MTVASEASAAAAPLSTVFVFDDKLEITGSKRSQTSLYCASEGQGMINVNAFIHLYNCIQRWTVLLSS